MINVLTDTYVYESTAHTQTVAEHRVLFDAAQGSSAIILTYIQLLACSCCMTSSQPAPNKPIKMAAQQKKS